jgi:AraC-like DNA-binding protein
MRVSPVNIKTLAHTLDLEGHDSAPVLAASGLPPFDKLNEDGTWLPVAVFARFLDEAVAAAGDPHFGLMAGKSLGLMRYGAIIPVMLNNAHMRQLMADLTRFGRLSVERVEMRLQEDRAGARIHVEAVVQEGPGGRFRTEMILTSTMQLLRLCGANNADILDVELPYDEPGPEVAPRYAMAFGPRILYGQTRCCVHFHPRLLDLPMPMHDLVAYTSAVARAEALLSAQQAGSDLAEQVRAVLLAALPEALSVADTATRVGLNERQLRRQLALLDTSHADLQQQCQRLKAERLMADGRMPLKQVADELGFGSVHSFHRAFKRWTGVTPATWKQD